MKTIVLAKYMENMDWLDAIPRSWDVIVRDGAPGAVDRCLMNCHFFQRSNYPAREVTAYLEWITSHYSQIGDKDIIVLAQANPFEHSPTFLADMEKDSPYLSRIHRCTPIGIPHYTGGLMNEYCQELGLEPQTEYVFVEGAQLRLRGENIFSRSLGFYEKCYEIATRPMDSAEGYSCATTFERLWLYIFNLPIPK